MHWYIFMIAMIACWVATLLAFIITHALHGKSSLVLTFNKLVLIWVIASGLLITLQTNWVTLEEGNIVIRGLQTLLLSLYDVMRLFALEGDFAGVSAVVAEHAPAESVTVFYSTVYTVINALAPALTFGFVLSFFKNVSAYLSYFFAFFKRAHIFSELNAKSLALAKSIMEEDKKKRKIKFLPESVIIFTDVMDKNEEENCDLVAEANAIGAILFRKDLSTIKFRGKSAIRKPRFYLISEDEAEKIRHASDIIKKYSDCGAELRVFSDNIECELLLSTRDIGDASGDNEAKRDDVMSRELKVIRVNDIQSLIYHNLDHYGLRLFENAKENGGVISCVIIGFGRYGSEMLKALTWFCQMIGYKLEITVIDADENAELKFEAKCPELMAKNHETDIGEARYDINFKNGVNVETDEFLEVLRGIPSPTYVFVCLGEDCNNIETAISVRTLYESLGKNPDIETVVYDSNVSERMSMSWGESVEDDKLDGIKNYRGQPYRIHMIGALETFYSVDSLINSDLVRAGYDVNQRWSKSNKTETKKPSKKKQRATEIEGESEFYKYEYNYRSSITKAIHERLKKKLSSRLGMHFPGVDKPWEELTDDEKLEIGKVEHVRWNAYMRTEGYSYSGDRAGSSRNDLAKKHNRLVSVAELSDDDLRKDA